MRRDGPSPPNISPSAQSESTKASSGSISSRASSFAHLLYPRKRPSNLLSLGKRASKQFGKGSKPKKESPAQAVSTHPTIVEISSPTRPTIERASTYTAVHSGLDPPRSKSSDITQSSTSRPVAKRLLSALDLKPLKPDPNIPSSPQRLRFVQPAALGFHSLSRHSSSEHGSPPLPRQTPQLSSSTSHLNFRADHIRQSTIEEDADHSNGFDVSRQPPRLGSPLQPSAATPNSPEASIPRPKPRTFMRRMLSRHASESAVEKLKAREPSTERLPNVRTPGSMISPSCATLRKSYFPHLRREQSSDASSQVSPKTVKPRSSYYLGDMPRSSNGPVDIKGWLDMNRGPVTSDVAIREGPHHHKTRTVTPSTDSFLPSEMKRINTPLMQPAVAARKHRSIYRGFHFDHAQTQESEDMVLDSPPLIKPLMPNPPLNLKGGYANERPRRFSHDFYKPQADQVVNEPEEGEEKDSTRTFSLDVPDHLPSSPLCPLHPKHIGGQKAICPMHGRGRRAKAQVPAAQKAN